MGKLVSVAQSLLDILKWLMEGSNWIFVLPLLRISLFIMFRMVRKKETFRIGRKGRHTTTFSSTDSLEQSRRTRRRR